MVKVMLLDVSGEVPPPYMPPGVPGLVTLTFAVPAVAVSASGIVVVNWVPLWAVASAVPFQLMVAFPLKLVPLTVSITPVVPEIVLMGLIWMMLGVVPIPWGVVAWLP